MTIKHILTSAFLLMSLYSLTAQKALKPNQFEGYIIAADGTKKEGIIEIGDINRPWEFQENVRFFDKALLANAKVKREEKKVCTPGEVIEYGIGNRKFLHVNYYVKGAGEDNIIKSTFGKIKDEKNTDFFAEVTKEGKITFLRFYIPPVITDEDEENDATIKEYITTAQETYDVLVSREGHKPKSLEDVSIKDFFSDCEYIAKKYSDGRYKMKPSKSIKSILKSDRTSGKLLDSVGVSMMKDYEEKCQ